MIHVHVEAVRNINIAAENKEEYVRKAAVRSAAFFRKERGKKLENLCFAAVGIFMVYYFVLVLYSGIHTDFAWIWILGAVTMAVMGILLKQEKKHPDSFLQWTVYILAVLFLICFLLFVYLCKKVISGMKCSGQKNLDYVIVLGAHVKGDVPSKALQKRLDKAYSYAVENPYTKFILSGGQGQGEDITEALCMKQYLLHRGVLSERLILEEESTNTRENLEFSHKITGCGRTRTGILSNNFHVYRAVRLAKKIGYISPEGIAAPSDLLMQVHYIVREVFALMKEQMKGNI